MDDETTATHDHRCVVCRRERDEHAAALCDACAGATAARCAALLRELLDGPLGDDLALTVEHDGDLRALLGALEGRARS